MLPTNQRRGNSPFASPGWGVSKNPTVARLQKLYTNKPSANQKSDTKPSDQERKRNRRVRRRQEANQKADRKAGKRKAQRRKDKMNAPLFPGGITTYGDFVKSRRAAVNEEFRPQEEQINEAANQIPAWYQDYLGKLQGLATQTTEQYQGLQGQAASLNQPAEGGASKEGIAAADARANIIKGLQGSLIQQQGAQIGKLQEFGAAATQRKIQKQEEVSKAKKTLAKAKGEFKTKYTTETKQREFENALAASEFGLKAATTKASIQSDRREQKNRETTYDKEFSKQAAKFGYSPTDWKSLGPRGRARKIAEEQRRSGSQPESIGRLQQKENLKIAAKHGYNLKQWRKLSPQRRAAIIRSERGDGKGSGGDGEFDWRTNNQRGEAASQTSKAKTIAEQLKRGQGIKGVNKRGDRRTRSDAAKLILRDPKSPEPVLVSAALDAAYNGYISRDTARRLRRAGIKVNELAQSLGVPTFSEWSKKQYSNPMSRHPRT